MDKKDKKRIIKDYDGLPAEVIAQIKLKYPRGFAQHLVFYVNKDGKRVSALPFETDEIYYLVRMSVQDAQQIIEDDDDYDEDGVLRDDFTIDDYAANEDSGYEGKTQKGTENLMFGMEEDDEQQKAAKKSKEDDLLLGMGDEEEDYGDEDEDEDEDGKSYEDEDEDDED